MDDGAFDALTRVLGGGAGSRRAAAGGLAGLALAAALGAPPTEARHRKKKKKCKACHVRKGKKCRKAPDDSACKGDGRCLDGKCNPKPNCLTAGLNCSTSDQCCSRLCIEIELTVCAQGGVGTPCLSNADCVSNSCIGFVCQKPPHARRPPGQPPSSGGRRRRKVSKSKMS